MKATSVLQNKNGIVSDKNDILFATRKPLPLYERVKNNKCIDTASARLKKDLEWYWNSADSIGFRESTASSSAGPSGMAERLIENWWSKI